MIKYGNILQDMPKDNSCRREDHARYHNDMPAYVRQAGAELVRKTVRSVLGDLTCYIYMMLKFIIDKEEKILNLNFTHQHTSRGENNDVVINWNTHYSGSFTSELLCEQINE